MTKPSDSNENGDFFGGDANGFFDDANHFTRMWSDFAAKMTTASMAFQPGQQPTEASRQVRDAALRVWSEQVNQFMRSEQFLSMMQKSLAGVIDSRRQMNELLGRIQYELQGVSRQDMDGVMQSIQHIEQRIADSVERLGDRLDAIDARLNALEKSAKPTQPTKPAKASQS